MPGLYFDNNKPVNLKLNVSQGGLMGHLFNPSVPLGISTNKYKHVTVTSSSPRTDPDKYPVKLCIQTTCPVRFVDCHSGFLIVTMNSLT